MITAFPLCPRRVCFLGLLIGALLPGRGWSQSQRPPVVLQDSLSEEVLVTATRTNLRIENLPTWVEVLGAEEMEEESSIRPASIASLFGDIAGAQIQPTSPTTGNLELRLQGLPGQYTQILRDGVPLYGGFAGSFGLLTVPPLDLKQVVLIKGSNTTLYGAGAIVGLVTW